MKKLLCAVLLALFIGGVVGCGSAEKAPVDNAPKAPVEAPK